MFFSSSLSSLSRHTTVSVREHSAAGDDTVHTNNKAIEGVLGTAKVARRRVGELIFASPLIHAAIVGPGGLVRPRPGAVGGVE